MVRHWCLSIPLGLASLHLYWVSRLGQELAWSSSATLFLTAVMVMPDKQCQGRKMDNTFGAQFCMCVLQSITVGKARQLEALRMCLCLLTPLQIRKQRVMYAGA